MGRWIDRLRRPTADNTANSFINQVVGNKADAAATGAVTATDTLVAYIKQLVTYGVAEADVEAKVDVIDEFHDVPAADNVLNAQINEVIGNKTDALAAGAVTETDTLVAYIKQLVTDAITATAAISTIDGLHDVPVADADTNLYVRDVVGIKTDAAAEGAVSSVESLMAYAKQSITLAIARDTALGVVDGLHDVPTADAETNLYMRDVIGIKTDAAAEGAVSAVESLMAYVKQLVTAAITEAAASATGVPQTAIKASGDMTGMNTGEILFTVTGDVFVKVGASVDVAVTSTSGTTTMEVGVIGNTACLCVQDALDNTAFAIGDSWTLDTAADANGAAISSEWVLVGNGVDIILTIDTDDITAGEIDFYCQFIPMSADGAVVAA